MGMDVLVGWVGVCGGWIIRLLDLVRSVSMELFCLVKGVVISWFLLFLFKIVCM